jgi:hypothetical protein
MAEHEVWLVTIDLPLKYINRGLEQGEEIIQKDIEDTNAELADAYDEAPQEEMPDQTGMEDMTGTEGMPPEEPQQ